MEVVKRWKAMKILKRKTNLKITLMNYNFQTIPRTNLEIRLMRNSGHQMKGNLHSTMQSVVNGLILA